jgi:response regulator RpfG family c-di-GMP phosphodiesterase
MNVAADKPVLLCVDDEPNILSGLRRAFRSGYQVLVANGGAEALDILRQQPVDLVISDMRMPAMNGAEFLAKVAEGWPQVMRLLLTGHADMGAVIQAINAGHIYGYYNKPCEYAELHLGVENALKQKRLTEERDCLMAQLAQRNQELNTLNTELDSKVKVRTAQLQTAMEQLKSSNQNLKKHYSDTVRAFSRFVDLREGKASGHARRVAEQARRLGQKLGLKAEELQDIVFAAMLLEVGKLSLPDRLIEKPILFLQKQERDNFLRHPTVGASVLKEIAPLRQAARLIALQNECFDGSGIPNGLAGDDIPIGARLLAVVRDYDLMQEGRISGKAMTTAEAQNQLRRMSGKKYDPLVVNMLIALVGEANIQGYRPVVEASPLDLTPGMEVVEIMYGGHVFLRDAVLTDEIIEEIDELHHNVDTALTIRVRARS